MNYFRKTKFRETSLIFVAIFIAIIYFTLSDSSEDSDVDVQALIDAAVEEAVEEAIADNSNEYTDKTVQSTTTTLPPALAIPVDNYWGQYSDGTWAIVRLTEKPDNFEWAWDIFNMEDPSGAYGFDEFDENSTLIGTLVDFDCSFNRISKTKEHKEAFHKKELGEFQTTIEYYDTYLDWAEDNYDYLTEEAVLTISKIMRGVWTCDYEYLESISTEYLDFVHSGDAYGDPYPEVPKFSEYIASFENNYDDDHKRGKYTYTLGALLYMTPAEENWGKPKIACGNDTDEWFGESPGYIWPMESMNPQQLRENQVVKMSMFDNGITKSLIDGTYQGDDGTYGFRLKISSDGVWYSYKYTGHPWPSGYSTSIPDLICQLTLPVPESSNDKIEGEGGTSDYNPTLLRDAGIITGDTFDSFVILLERTTENDSPPGWYSVRKGGNPCVTDEGGCKVPDDFIEYLNIRGAFCSWDSELMESTWTNPGLITVEGSNLVAKFYGCFEGESDFLLKIEPGATFRSYRTANPPAIVIEVDK